MHDVLSLILGRIRPAPRGAAEPRKAEAELTVRKSHVNPYSMHNRECAEG